MNSIKLLEFVTFACLIAAASAAQVPRVVRQAAPQSSGPISPQAEVAAKAAAQQAKLHYVEIGPSLKGDYKFGYDTGSGPAGQSFREETRLDDGTVKGAYGYVDANGKQRIVKYTAGKEGFVVENDQEAPKQAGSPQASPARPAEQLEVARRPQPANLPQTELRQAQPVFDEQQPRSFPVNRAVAAPREPTPEDRARAEREHAEGLRQHQLAQEAALAEQQKLAQQLQAQQQAILAAQPRQQAQQPQSAGQFSPQAQFPQPPQHQVVDPQTGSFFSRSEGPQVASLFQQQFRQQQPSQPQPELQQQFASPAQFHSTNQQMFAAQAAPAFQQQAATQFGGQAQDFGQLRAARQAAATQQFPQHAHQQHPAGAQSVLAALHQQQQQDAQMLAQLRAQHLARLQEQARQAPQPQQARIAPKLEQSQSQTQQFQAEPQSQFVAQPQRLPQQQAASSQLQAQHQSAVQPQPQESFGPPVIDIRTLNYSIGMQTRV